MMKAKPYLQQIQLRRDRVPDFESYPFNIPIIKDLNTLTFHEDVTFFVGENGMGKSTLIEGIALAMGFGIEGGSKNVQISSHNNASSLSNYLWTTKSYQVPYDHYFLRAESFYNVATYMEEIYDTPEDIKQFERRHGVKSLHQCSHGEAFMATLNRLSGEGLYIFDEPEAALSPSRQLAALSVIDRLVKEKSQFIIATHSPILLAYPNAIIYQLSETGIKQVKYEETEHFMITKYFLNNYNGMLKEILQ